jgi:hypothetical protein
MTKSIFKLPITTIEFAHARLQRLAIPINTRPITYPANINVTNVQVPFGA